MFKILKCEKKGAEKTVNSTRKFDFYEITYKHFFVTKKHLFACELSESRIFDVFMCDPPFDLDYTLKSRIQDAVCATRLMA